MHIRISTTAAVNVGLQIDIVSSDPVTGLAVCDRRIIPLAALTNSHRIYLRMPVDSEMVAVTFTVIGVSGNTVSISDYVLMSTTREIENFIARTTIPPGAATPGFQGTLVAGTAPDGKIIALASVSIPASTDEVFVLPLYSGRVKISASTTANNATLAVLINSLVAPTAPAVYQGDTAANGLLSDFMDLPAYQCSVSLNNTQAAAITANLAIMSDDAD